MVLVVENGRALERAVAVSNRNGEDVTLSAGLATGERVVTEGPVDLADGSPVSEVPKK